MSAAPKIVMKKQGDVAELLIYSEIDSSGLYGISARDVVAALKECDGAKRLDVRINSGGGDVFDGIAIYEALRRFEGEVHVYVDGLAASAASVIAMAGDKRSISMGGFFMVHRASGLVFGDDDDMRAMADILASITEQIGGIYAERTGIDRDEIRGMVAKETWMTAEESLDSGFATAIIRNAGTEARGPEAFAAKISNAQRAFANGVQAKAKALSLKPNPAAPPPTDEPHGGQAAELHQAPSSGAFLLAKNERSVPMNREAQLRERLETATIKAEKLKGEADAAGRDLTNEEIRTIRELKAEMDDIEAQLDALKIVADATERLAAPLPRKGEQPKAEGGKPQYGQTTVIGSVAAKRTDGGFTQGFGEFALAVRASTLGERRDERLFRNVETTFGSGSAGADGGFAIPEDFRKEIISNAIDQDNLLSRCGQLPTSSRQVTLTTRESQVWGSTGVQSYAIAEGGTYTRSKMALKSVTLQLHKTGALCPVTEEMLEDAPLLEAELKAEATEQINFKLSNQVVRGTGANEMLGFLNAPCLATVAAEGSQTADTVTIENINNMYAAMPPKNRNNAVWLCHPDVEPLLWLGKFHLTADPIGRAPGTLPNSPFGTLMGRPVIPHEVCETKGDLGDIMFVDLSQYALPIKSGGIKASSSMHMAFDQDIMMFKFSIRAGGAPRWSSTVASRDGSFVRSPFIVLAAR